jgi:sugar phosphate isomerase/epimerase
MRLSLPGQPHLTYCTNIHAGEAWSDILASLRVHLPPIKAAVAPDQPFGLGLRLSGIAADVLAEPETLEEFRRFLDEQQVYLFTINAFPYGPFHGTRVKEDVYQPDWRSDERLRFTNLSADLLAALMPAVPELAGSVSTVPGTFKPLAAEPGAVSAMAAHYLAHAAHLVELERRTGRRVALSIEPEPCCFLETIAETIAFFEGHLLSEEAASYLAGRLGVSLREARDLVRRHVGVCYDVCHAAVEFEDPRGSIDALERAGIAITKLQLSSALRVPQVDAKAERRLRPFDVGVYLHQVVEQHDGCLRRFPDLPEALETVRDGSAAGEWRIHCHVPVFLADLGDLGTTQGFLAEVLDLCRQRCISQHLEVETYTWDVLPAAYRGEDKATSIARELRWTLEQLTA